MIALQNVFPALPSLLDLPNVPPVPGLPDLLTAYLRGNRLN